MATKDEALKLALEALEEISSQYMSLTKKGCMALAAIEEALAEQPAQQQEPVAVYVGETWCGSVVRLYEDLPLETPLYTSPPASKPWVGLTDEEFQWIYDNGRTPAGMIEMAEAKLREKNA